jgi:hypothetical protein
MYRQLIVAAVEVINSPEQVEILQAKDILVVIAVQRYLA